MNAAESRWLTSIAAAEYLGLPHEDDFNDLAIEHELPTIILNTRAVSTLRYDRETIDTWMKGLEK